MGPVVHTYMTTSKLGHFTILENGKVIEVVQVLYRNEMFASVRATMMQFLNVRS